MLCFECLVMLLGFSLKHSGFLETLCSGTFMSLMGSLNEHHKYTAHIEDEPFFRSLCYPVIQIYPGCINTQNTEGLINDTQACHIPMYIAPLMTQKERIYMTTFSLFSLLFIRPYSFIYVL